MTALQTTGFDGALSLEIFNDQFRAGSARSVAVDGYRSLLFLLDQLRARTGAAQAGLPALPPRSKCLGTEFIEFAIDEAGAVAFEACLQGLGFARAGVHKSKSVTRWRQGAINIVVNTEKEGFAHSYNITHGTSVCAIGLRVEDAAATLDRAQKLLDQPFRQAVGPGELEIPAVRGARRQPDLLHRSQERPGQGLGHRVRADRRGRRQGRTPASPSSTTSRSRCTTRRC